MQRDMEIVIEIMKAIAEHPDDEIHQGFCYVISEDRVSLYGSREKSLVIISKQLCTENTMIYHRELMREAGLINPPNGGDFCSLSWAGNDFLDAIQQEGVLPEIESTHGEAWRKLSFNVLSSVCTEIAKKLILNPS